VIWDAEELRQQMSFLAYHNLTLLADGDRTLRDIAIQLKQPLVPLTRSLSPYLQSRIVGLAQVGDWDRDRMSLSNRRTTPPSTTPPSTTPPTAVAAQARSTPLIAYIEDSRFDSVAMSQIVAQAGYRFINVRNPIEALPILLEQKPSLIFLDLLMPVTNGYEVCTQVRRISAFKDTPIIIVTSKDGIVDRVRAKLAGSSEFITKPIERDKVLSVLENYLKSY
jgi:chemotaxis family two-component system response regulator PixG